MLNPVMATKDSDFPAIFTTILVPLTLVAWLLPFLHHHHHMERPIFIDPLEAESFGLPYLSAYLDSLGREQLLMWRKLCNIRIHNHARTKWGICKEEYFSKPLYKFDIGQNDLTAGFLRNMTLQKVKASVPDLVNSFTSNLKAYNEVAQYFNQNLKEALAQLRFELPHVACCGYGGEYNFNDIIGCGGTIKINGTDIFVGSCERPSVRVIWVGTHYTEAANKVVFDLISSGAFTDPPIPMKMA
ncbi:Esterase protein [Spatholobus suberectus]|nr:Esterase protein [Spatholobus suberectus]